MSCRKATEKIEKSKFEKLSFVEATTLKLHLGLCKDCQDYKKYSEQLDQFLFREFGNKEIDASQLKVSLTEEEKQNLIEKLKNQ